MTHDHAIDPLLDGLFRTEYARLVGLLVRMLGAAHLQLAEDVTQDALMAALHHWPQRGVPDNPSAWLLQVARRRALDVLRRDATLAQRADIIGAEFDTLLAKQGTSADPEEAWESDDQLRLIFLCCHPALSIDSQVALTLKLVGGFGTGEIARALLTEEPAVAQRLVRAKRTLRDLDAPVTLPSPAELPARLDATLHALYLMFNEGHTAHEGAALLRADLCHEALRLARLLLVSPVTATPKASALAALFCFHASRLGARTDAQGSVIRLADQDRTRWDRRLVAEGMRHLDASARGAEVSTYHLEAEIASMHATAPSWRETAWPRILAVYDQLLAMTGSPVIALNRIVALSQTAGPAAALAELQPLTTSTRLQGYHLFHAVHADLLTTLGRSTEAAEAYRQARDLARSEPVRALMEQRLAGIVAEG